MSSQTERVTLENILEEKYLRDVFRKIRKGLSELLVIDPVHLVHYQKNIDRNLKSLAYRVKNGSYSPKSQIIVQAAKKDGLVRPLAFLEIEDQILLKAICDQLEPHLIDDFPDYVDCSRTHTRATPPEVEADSFFWFEAWLENRKKLEKMLFNENGFDYLVEADLANFFQQVNLDILKSAVSSKVPADEDAINLLFHLLRSFASQSNLTDKRSVGLPQENFDASRILAHYFLKPIDHLLEEYGENGRYVRWVDDMRIFVENETEGRKVLHEIQTKAEARNLFLNTSKSGIVKKIEKQSDYFPDLNGFLEQIHEKTKNEEEVNIEKFNQRLSDFLEREKTGNWIKILKRFYTEARRVGSEGLEELFVTHLNEYPGITRNIVKYLRGRPHRNELLNKIIEFLKSPQNFYEDVEILLFELLTTWRFEGSINNSDQIEQLVKFSLDYLHGRNSSNEVKHSYTRGLISILVYKFGTPDNLEQIKNMFEYGDDRYFVRYAFLALYGTERFRNNAADKVLKSDDLELRRIASFLEDCSQNPEENRKILKHLMLPKKRIAPERRSLDPRALPIYQITNIQEFRDEWTDRVNSTQEKLKEAQDSFIDKYTIEWLSTEKDRR